MSICMFLRLGMFPVGVMEVFPIQQSVRSNDAMSRPIVWIWVWLKIQEGDPRCLSVFVFFGGGFFLSHTSFFKLAS